jgi:hypothetical protein
MVRFLHQQQKNWHLLVLFLGLTITTYSQQQLKFIPTFNGSRYALTNKVAINKDTLTIDLLKFYISDIKLLEDSIEVYSPKEKHYLFNLENPSAMSISLNVDSNINFNKIKFCIGIDSITNVAGAIGGTLDPINGMYWAWNSGYVNFKIEGTSTLSNARKNAFKFHLGGYQHPYNSYRAVLIKIDDLSKTAININLEQFLTKIEFSQINSVMSPNTKSIELTNLLPPIFSTLKLD